MYSLEMWEGTATGENVGDFFFYVAHSYKCPVINTLFHGTLLLICGFSYIRSLCCIVQQEEWFKVF